MTALAVVTEEVYVVVNIVDGIAQTAELHLPAPERAYATFEGQARKVRFDQRIENGFPPESWPPACGAFDRGSIYVQGGPLEHRPICPGCSQAVESPKRLLSTVAQTEVLALLGTGPQTRSAVALARGTTKQAAGQTLLRLMSRGLIVRDNGVYSLVKRQEHAA